MTQDFSSKNLQGCSFKGKNLTGANFSYADIQGTDFTNAILISANFRRAKAGLQRRWIIALAIVSLLLSALSGFIASWAGIFVGNKLIDGDLAYVFARRVTIIILFAVFFFATTRRGLGAGLRTVALAAVLAAASSAALAVALTVTGAGAGTLTGALTGAGRWVGHWVGLEHGQGRWQGRWQWL